MQHLTEHKFQTWRAVAVSKSGVEYLLTLGRSHEDVKALIPGAVEFFLEKEDVSIIKHISLERWYGVADRGRWTKQDIMRLPHPTKAVNFFLK